MVAQFVSEYVFEKFQNLYKKFFCYLPRFRNRLSFAFISFYFLPQMVLWPPKNKITHKNLKTTYTLNSIKAHTLSRHTFFWFENVFVMLLHCRPPFYTIIAFSFYTSQSRFSLFYTLVVSYLWQFLTSNLFYINLVQFLRSLHHSSCNNTHFQSIVYSFILCLII